MSVYILIYAKLNFYVERSSHLHVYIYIYIYILYGNKDVGIFQADGDETREYLCHSILNMIIQV